MAHEWIYRTAGLGTTDDEEGPFAESEIFELAGNGTLTLNTPVSSPTRTQGNWYLLSQIPRLAQVCQDGERRRQQQQEAAQKQREQQEAAQKQREHESPPPLPPRSPPPPPPQAFPAFVTSPLGGQSSAKRTLHRRQYPALKIIVVVLYVLTALVVVNFLLMTGLSVWGLFAYESPFDFNFRVAITAFIIGLSLLGHAVLAILLVAVAELIRVSLDIQDNTHEASHYAKYGPG